MNEKDIKILLVDDEPDILEIVGYNLSNEGYQVITAENGLQAIKKAKKEKPQLIILDVMMPEMDGIEACENIRKIPELNNTIITFLTARGEDYSQVAGFDAGADDYITKPVKPKVLVSKVKALLRRVKEADLDTSVVKIGNLIINREEYKIILNKDASYNKKGRHRLNILDYGLGSIKINDSQCHFFSKKLTKNRISKKVDYNNSSFVTNSSSRSNVPFQ